MTESEHHVDSGETEKSPCTAAEQMMIDSLEEIFKDRFTEKDELFMKTMKTPLSSPPLVQNWYTRPKRSFDWTRDRDGGRGGHRSSGRPYYAGAKQDNYNDRGYGNQHHDRRQHRGGGYHGNRQDNSRHHPYHGQRQGNQYGNHDNQYGSRDNQYGKRDNHHNNRDNQYNRDNQGRGGQRDWRQHNTQAPPR